MQTASEQATHPGAEATREQLVERVSGEVFRRYPALRTAGLIVAAVAVAYGVSRWIRDPTAIEDGVPWD